MGGLVGVLAACHILSQTMEAYIAHLFSARMASFIFAASLEDLDWIEDIVLPNLPASAEWQEASAKILQEASRQTERLTRLGGTGCLSDGASFAERRREARVQAVVEGMRRIDAGIHKESLQDAGTNGKR